MSRSKVKVTGEKKTQKCGILFASCPRVAFFAGSVVLGGASTPVGKSEHAV